MICYGHVCLGLNNFWIFNTELKKKKGNSNFFCFFFHNLKAWSNWFIDFYETLLRWLLLWNNWLHLHVINVNKLRIIWIEDREFVEGLIENEIEERWFLCHSMFKDEGCHVKWNVSVLVEPIEWLAFGLQALLWQLLFLSVSICFFRAITFNETHELSRRIYPHWPQLIEAHQNVIRRPENQIQPTYPDCWSNSHDSGIPWLNMCIVQLGDVFTEAFRQCLISMGFFSSLSSSPSIFRWISYFNLINVCHPPSQICIWKKKTQNP